MEVKCLLCSAFSTRSATTGALPIIHFTEEAYIAIGEVCGTTGSDFARYQWVLRQLSQLQLEVDVMYDKIGEEEYPKLVESLVFELELPT